MEAPDRTLESSDIRSKNVSGGTHGGVGLTGPLKNTHPRSIVHRPGNPSRRRLAVGIFIGASALLLAFTLLPTDPTSANPSRTGGSCGCHPVTSSPFTTVTGFPSGSYMPGMNYSITVSVLDTSTAGDNHFNFIVSAGTLGTLDPNTRLVSSLQVAAQTTTTNTWNFYWVAPASGSVTADVWAVDGSGAGRDDPYERITFGSVEIPEFGILVIPVAGTFGVLFLAKRARSR